eukprot:scaffold654_cov207-Ochromonas_danica.AAC.13
MWQKRNRPTRQKKKTSFLFDIADGKEGAWCDGGVKMAGEERKRSELGCIGDVGGVEMLSESVA